MKFSYDNIKLYSGKDPRAVRRWICNSLPLRINFTFYTGRLFSGSPLSAYGGRPVKYSPLFTSGAAMPAWKRNGSRTSYCDISGAVSAYQKGSMQKKPAYSVWNL